MTGKELQKAIRGSGIKIADLEKLSGILEGTIYSLYNKAEVEEHYLEKLEKAGVVLNKTQKSTIAATPELKVIELLERLVKSHENEIEHLKSEVRTLKNSGEVEALRLAVKRAEEEIKAKDELLRIAKKLPMEGTHVTAKKRD